MSTTPAMVVLNRIYTRTGDDGTTALGTGKRIAKTHPRIEAFGGVDETNAAVGVARLHTGGFAELGAMLERIQNELFDVGADLCMPTARRGGTTLRMSLSQVERLENEIDRLNAGLQPLRSFVLPGGHPAAAHLHHCRTICRRAERAVVALSKRRGEKVGREVLLYMNRLSDFLFVASRWVNARGEGDILWQPGKTQNL